MADYDDEEVGAPYEWQSLDVAAEEEAPTEKYIKAPGRCVGAMPAFHLRRAKRWRRTHLTVRP